MRYAAGLAADVPALLGYEGRAAALYWPALAALVRPGWAIPDGSAFTRQRRPADNPFNVTLNMLAWLLARDVHALVLRHGLHPAFGALHTARDGALACVWDLVEEFRAPLAEGLAVYLFNNRMLRERDFEERAETRIRLGRDGQRTIIRTYERWLERDIKSPRSGRRLRWRRLLEEQVVAYARHVRGEQPYRAYLMDY